MGGEILSYAFYDWKTHILAEPGQREVREFKNLYDVVEAALPEIQKVDRYTYLGPGASAPDVTIRYLTYPSLPIEPRKTDSIDKLPPLTLIFARTDINIGKNGDLLIRNQPFRSSGTLLESLPLHSALMDFTPRYK